MATVTTYTRYCLSEADRHFDLTTEPADKDHVLLKQFPDGRAVVGYLAEDSDCADPIEDCNGMGNILRFDDPKVRHEALRAIGCDPYGPRDRDIVPNPFAVLLDKYEHGASAWSIMGEGMQDRWDTSRGAGVWIPDDACLEHILSRAIARLLPEGTTVSYVSRSNADGTCITRPCKPGEKSYFKKPDGTDAGTVADERYHNIVTYQLPDGRTRGGYKCFRTAYLAAARALGIKIDRAAKDKGARAAAIDCARNACEQYTMYVNGECYGHIVLVFDQDNQENAQDSCWGYVGCEYAEGRLKEEFDFRVKQIEKELLPGINPEPAKENSDAK